MTQIKLNRQVYNKSAFNDTVSNQFVQLVNTPDLSTFDVNLATQEDFWILYDKYFYEIPKEGEINSHTYLIQTSGDYVNYTPQQEEIDALLQEIVELRQENLELRQEYATSLSELSGVELPVQVDLPVLPSNQTATSTTNTTVTTSTSSGGVGRGSGSGNLLAK